MSSTVNNQTASLFYNSRCTLGEGPLWFEKQLYWFDILQQQLHYCSADGTTGYTLDLPEQFSAAAPLLEEQRPCGLLLASATGLWQWQPQQNSLQRIMTLEAQQPHTRSNDGRADRHGGFWISTMGQQAESGAGSLYRYYQGECVTLRRHLSIPNAICFSPQGDYAYFTDSAEKIVYRWALDRSGWPLGEPAVWLDLSAQSYVPDGAVVDSQGCVWNAHWDGGAVVRYRPDAQVDKVIQVPVSRPTCPAFGGADLKRLFISSARTGLDQATLEQQPLAGSVFYIDLDVAGLADGGVLL